MKKTITLILVLALGPTSVSLAAEGAWTRKADMPTVRWELSTCVVDGKIYAIGGASPVYQASRAVEAYDPVTDTWTTKSEMPTARSGLSASVVDGKIYAIGGGAASSSSFLGMRSLSTVEEYDPATDTWTTKSEMPTGRYQHSTSVVDGRIYVIGGSPSYPWSPIRALDVYEPATDTWTREGNIPVPRYTSSSSVVDGKIYVFGGYSNGHSADEYDPMTDTWTRKAAMPIARHGLSTSVLDGKIYAIGGHPGHSPYPGIAAVDVYDAATDTWTTATDMPTGRFCPSTGVVDGKIYAIGGMGYWIGNAYGMVEAYDPYLLVVDFNDDFEVDIKDLIILIEFWGTDEPLCDIAPRPFGDGIIDVQDLEFLMSYWGQEVYDPHFVAHWKLDETEGDIAYDSAAVNDATVMGDALWQPDSGMVKGGLQFDGIDDYIKTPFKLNPADAEFSVFAWIKGGVPGQVILSQEIGANWLMAGEQGVLRTDIAGPVKAVRRGKKGWLPLISQTVITDGVWHRVGFVWDGVDRILYMDDVEVARDTVDSLKPERDWLNIGVDPDFQPGAFWSGMIDDVRVYKRVVVP